tara:strand:- start:235 stop:378 length:144 start_codon:yes stop_codon:yes gene_type:complete
MPTVNQRYKRIKIILSGKLLGTEIYSLKNASIKKIITPTNKKNFTKE